MTTILEKDQYILIYRVSYLSLFSSMYALYKRHSNLAMVPGSVFLTSIFYWQHPDYSYRRYLDMIVVQCALLYQYSMAYHAQYANAYYTLTNAGICFYIIGYYFSLHQDSWKSTYSHILLHIFANIGNIVLYSGNIRLPIKDESTLSSNTST